MKQLLRTLLIPARQSEPHKQNQNPAERKIQEIKASTTATMDRTGAPSWAWFLCLTCVVVAVLNIVAVKKLSWRSAIRSRVPLYWIMTSWSARRFWLVPVAGRSTRRAGKIAVETAFFRGKNQPLFYRCLQNSGGFGGLFSSSVLNSSINVLKPVERRLMFATAVDLSTSIY